MFYNQHFVWFGAFSASDLKWTRVPYPVPAVDPDTLEGFLNLLASEMPTPFTRQFSLGVERVLPLGIVARIDGLLIQGRNLPISRMLPGDAFQMLHAGEAKATMLVLQLRKHYEHARIDLHYTLADRKTTSDRWNQTVDVRDPMVENFSSELAPAK